MASHLQSPARHHHEQSERRRWMVAVLGLMLVLAACGDDSAATTTSASTTTTVAGTTTLAATTTAPTTTTPAGPVISVADNALGQILTDPDGMTIYLLLDDAQGASTCTGGCPSNWPPLLAEVGVGAGVDASLLDTIARSDGTVQVTYNGWPLYRYVGDGEPGDTRGQNVGSRWYVVSPLGEPIQ